MGNVNQAYELEFVVYEKNHKGKYDYSAIYGQFQDNEKFITLKEAESFLKSKKHLLNKGEGIILSYIERDQCGDIIDVEHITEFSYELLVFMKNVEIIKEQNLPLTWLEMELRTPSNTLKRLFNKEISRQDLKDYQVMFVDELAAKIDYMGNVKVVDMELVER